MSAKAKPAPRFKRNKTKHNASERKRREHLTQVLEDLKNELQPNSPVALDNRNLVLGEALSQLQALNKLKKEHELKNKNKVAVDRGQRVSELLDAERTELEEARLTMSELMAIPGIADLIRYIRSMRDPDRDDTEAPGPPAVVPAAKSANGRKTRGASKKRKAETTPPPSRPVQSPMSSSFLSSAAAAAISAATMAFREKDPDLGTANVMPLHARFNGSGGGSSDTSLGGGDSGTNECPLPGATRNVDGSALVRPNEAVDITDTPSLKREYSREDEQPDSPRRPATPEFMRMCEYSNPPSPVSGRNGASGATSVGIGSGGHGSNAHSALPFRMALNRSGTGFGSQTSPLPQDYDVFNGGVGISSPSFLAMTSPSEWVANGGNSSLSSSSNAVAATKSPIRGADGGGHTKTAADALSQMMQS